jgi:hypothetical protein
MRKTRYPGRADVVAGEGEAQSDHDRTRRKSDDALGNAVFMIVYFNMASIEESPAERRHGPAGAKHEEAEISGICVVKAGLLVPPVPAGDSRRGISAPGQHLASTRQDSPPVFWAQQFRSINTSQKYQKPGGLEPLLNPVSYAKL